MNILKHHIKPLAFCFLIFVCHLTNAQDDNSQHQLSYTIGFYSDYLVNGISQTGNKPAAQASIDYSYVPLNVYAGIWVSNIDGSKVGFDGAHMETDYYLGWGKSWENFKMDIGAVRYHYYRTDYDDNNTNEYHILSGYDFDFIAIDATVNYSPDSFGAGKYYYYELESYIPLPKDFQLTSHYAWTRYDKSVSNGGGKEYEDWHIGLARSLMGLDFSLKYHDVHGLDKSEDCNDPFTCKSKLVFGVSKTF